MPQHHGNNCERWLPIAVRAVFQERAAGQQPRLHAARIPPSTPHTHKSEAEWCFLPQQGVRPPAGLRKGRHLVRRQDEHHTGCHMGGRSGADHRGCAGRGGRTTSGVTAGHRIHHLFRAADATAPPVMTPAPPIVPLTPVMIPPPFILPLSPLSNDVAVIPGISGTGVLTISQQAFHGK